MADVFKILFLILGMLLCTMCYWLLFQALFSARVEQSRQAILAHPWRIFFTGALVGGPVLLLGVALLQGAGPAKFIGGATIVTIVTLALFGSTGLVRHVGEQLSAGGTQRPSGLTVLRGGAVVAVACVLPIVGWFFLIPVVLITGFGASLRTLKYRRPTPLAVPVTAVQS
tara:strand:- start:823 stop:1332 length:510 start_codon:yes stop_codon:yes gene_type:complete